MADVDPGLLRDLLLESLAVPTPLSERRERDENLRRFNETFVAAQLADLGTRITFDPLGSLTAYLDGRPPPLLFVCYVMTHPAGTMADAFDPRVVEADFGLGPEPAVRGRGACEQRGAMAALLGALRSRPDPALRRAVVVVSLVSGESGSHEAVASALAGLEQKPEAGVVTVCTDNGIVIGHKGRLDVHLTAKGRAAHSSSPSLGSNAAEAMISVLPQVLAARRSTPHHPQLGAATTALVDLRSGPEGSHTIPERCAATLDVRLLPGEDPTDVLEMLRQAAADGRGESIEVRVGNQMLPAAVPETASIVLSLSTAFSKELGQQPHLRWFSASTDMGYVNSVGIPTVCFGPGDERLAHTEDDRVSVRQVTEAARVLARLIGDTSV